LDALVVVTDNKPGTAVSIVHTAASSAGKAEMAAV
jgi:hypothetical protein